MAWNYLIEKGYKLLEKNYSCRLGEIDVVAKKEGRYRFVEIKTRAQKRFGMPEESVHHVKQKRLVRLALWYLKEKKLGEPPVSFDVLSVYYDGEDEPGIRLIENAFSVDNEIG
ncbi:MAG: YraN family protein [Candidatus Omnitrophica bacterium]|nr:YraN family protein [Candidatus Omnitrophota bacterium]